MTIGAQMAFPASETVRMPPLALEMVSVAAFEPRVAGWNATATVAAAPGARVVALGAATVNSPALAPSIANGGVSVTGAGSLFVIVTVADDTDPSAAAPKSIAAGVTAIPGVPAPLNAIEGEPPSALAIASVATNAAAVVGWNPTV